MKKITRNKKKEEEKKKKKKEKKKNWSCRVENEGLFPALLFGYNWKDRTENKRQGQFMAAMPSEVGG